MSNISKPVIQAHDVVFAAVVRCRKCLVSVPLVTDGFILGFFDFTEADKLSADDIRGIKNRVNWKVEELQKKGWVFSFGEKWQLSAECPDCWKAGGAV